MVAQFAQSSRQPSKTGIPASRSVLRMIAAALGLLCILPQLAAQPPARDNPRWYLSYEMFQMLLEERGLAVAGLIETALSQPRESVVLLFGDQRSVSRDEWLRLRRFVAQGGSLLIASERSILVPGVCSLVNGPVSTSLPEAQYLDHPDCIRITALESEHPATSGLREIIVNRCGWLTTPEDESLNWTSVASLPERCRPSSASGKPVVLAGLDSDPEGGVMLLAADQSLFSNGMMWHGDNSLLAIRVADLLCRGQRTRLFVMSGSRVLPGYRQSLTGQPQMPPRIPPVTPPPDLPAPDLATMLKIANKVVDRVQETNLLNRTLRDRPRNMRPLAWLRTILLILLIALGVFALWRMMQRTSWLSALRKPARMHSMFDAATARQVQRNEFGAALEILARDLCTGLTGSPVEAEWLKLKTDDYLIQGALSRSQRKGLVELVEIAVRGCRIPLSKRKFQAMGRLVHSLRLLYDSNVGRGTGTVGSRMSDRLAGARA